MKLVMILAISAFPSISVAVPQNSSGRARTSNEAQNCCTHQRPPERTWDGWYNDPIAIFTLCLVLATSGLWVFTGRLWRATVDLGEDTKTSSADQAAKMERSASAMERVADSTAANTKLIIESVEHQKTFGRMQMRAYVSVLGDGLYQDESHIFEARPVLKNTGHTPAQHIKWRIKADILPVPLPADFDFPLPEEAPGQSILNPQQDGFMSAGLDPDKFADRWIPEAELSDVKKGIGRGFYAWGIVTYRDSFGEARHVKFAHLYTWFPRPVEEGKLRRVDEGRVSYLNRHNEAD